jgi:hypothetical protein
MICYNTQKEGAKMLVRVFRAHDWDQKEIDTEIIDTSTGAVKWVTNTGLNNGHIPKSYYLLQCYISYEAAVSLNLASGTHSDIARSAKIFLHKKDNNDPKYREGYKYLCSLAGSNPNRSSVQPGRMPCTKKIMEILGVQKLLREDVINQLITLGYDKETIVGALKRLEKQNKIQVFKSGNYKKWEVKAI